MYELLYITISYIILLIFDQTNMKIHFQQAACQVTRLNLLRHRLLCLPESHLCKNGRELSPSYTS